VSDFERTLRFLNLKPVASETYGKTTVWQAEQILGLGVQRIVTVEIGVGCTESDLDRAMKSSLGRPTKAILKLEQDRKRHTEYLQSNGFDVISLERDILFGAASGLLGGGTKLNLPRATIEPEIQNAVSRTKGLCTRQIADWLRNESGGSLAVLTGPAGFGKTTICKILINRILDAPGLKRIPLYISSANWQGLIESHHVTLRGIFLEAVSSTFSQAAMGEEVVEHLIGQGAIIPIFDGLDEICTDAYTEIGIREIVDQLEELFVDTPDARVLFTTRNTFWSSARADDRLKFSEFRVQPFDANRRTSFLEEWFDSDDAAMSRAVRLLGRIEALGSARASSASDQVSFSESPYMLHLACLAAEEQSGMGFDEDTWADVRDPLDAILRSLAAREVFKNKISPAKQNRILYTTALLHGEVFGLDDFSEVIDTYKDEDERLEGMLSHHVISGKGDRRRFLFHGFGDYLRAKAIASWLFEDEDQVFGIEEYLSQINSENDTSVDIFGEISGFYGGMEQLRLAFSKQNVQRLFSGRTGQGLMLIFARATRQHGLVSHQDVANEINIVFLDGSNLINSISFEGQVEGISLKGINFENCEFNDTIFRNCEFDENTIFSASCVFKKRLCSI
jgi:hypothetical protein